MEGSSPALCDLSGGWQRKGRNQCLLQLSGMRQLQEEEKHDFD